MLGVQTDEKINLVTSQVSRTFGFRVTFQNMHCLAFAKNDQRFQSITRLFETENSHYTKLQNSTLHSQVDIFVKFKSTLFKYSLRKSFRLHLSTLKTLLRICSSANMSRNFGRLVKLCYESVLKPLHILGETVEVDVLRILSSSRLRE